MVERPEFFTVELQLPMETKQKGVYTVSPATARIEIIDGVKFLHSHTCMYKYKDHIVVDKSAKQSLEVRACRDSFTSLHNYIFVCLEEYSHRIGLYSDMNALTSSQTFIYAVLESDTNGSGECIWSPPI